MRHDLNALWLALLLAVGASLAACGVDTNAESAGDDETLTEEQGMASSDETAVAPAPAPAPRPAASKPSTQLAETDAPVSAAAAKPVCADCGTITQIEKKTEEGEGTGAGAVTGAVIGGVAGREIVKGDRGKRNIAGVLGAIAGGYAGHKIEEKARSTDFYKISVKMESDGRIEVVRVESAEGLSVGQAVRVVDGNIVVP